MTEDKTINQDPIDQQKIAQLEKELEQIETKTSQEPKIGVNQPAQVVEPVKQATPVPVQEAKAQGLMRSNKIFWLAIFLLILSFVGVGIYLLS